MVLVSENAAKLAVLVDADNAQPSITEGLLGNTLRRGERRLIFCKQHAPDNRTSGWTAWLRECVSQAGPAHVPR